MKKAIITIMLLAVALMARAFDFSAPTPQGQTLYYTVVSSNTVKVVAPSEDDGWVGYTAPEGRLQIPSTVEHEGTQYTVVSIDRWAFEECQNLTAVRIPGSVATISRRAFANCTALTSAVLEEGVQKIDMMAFMACTLLDTIALPSTLTRIGMSAFDNTGYYNNTDNWSSVLTLSIGQWLIKAANTVTEELVVSDGIVGIANNAFYYCRYLQGITLPSTVRYIGDGGFQQCAVLDTLRVLAEEPPVLGDEAFEGVPSVTVVVPCGTLAAYAAAPRWSTLSLMEAACPPHDSTGIVPVENRNALLLCMENGGVTVHNAEGRTLQVYDAMGRCVCTIPRAAGRQQVQLPQVGVYVLRCDGESRKIIYSK